jgi:hypothetical protein
VPGEVKNVKQSVAGVEHVTFVEVASERRWRKGEGPEIIALMRKDSQEFGAYPARGATTIQVWCSIIRRFYAVAQSCLEFMGTSNMIKVTMSADRSNGLFSKCCDLRLERSKAHAAVNKQIAVAPVDEPHVASHPRHHVAFQNPAQPVINFLDLIPWTGRSVFHAAVCFSRKR